MQAITLKAFGSPTNFSLEEVPRPAIGDSEVLIKVKAISINPVDVKTRLGKAALADELKKYAPIILGWDVSGEVVEKGQDVQDFEIGDDVFGMVNFVGHGKAYAEYIAAPASQLALKPTNVSHEEAAASTLAALTAWQAFTHFGKLERGDKTLIHAAAGGVGHFAVQIAKHLGAYVIGTASDYNKNFIQSIGADEHIDYKKVLFEDVLSDIDFALETIGGKHFEQTVQVLKPGATIINLPSGLTEKVKQKARDKNLNATFFMSVYSSGEDMKQIAKFLKEGIIQPYISKKFNFDQIKEAHKQIESGSTRGKVVLTI